MTSFTKPVKPRPGETITYMGRKLTHNPDGTITSQTKGRPDLIHPNWSRTMDAINLATGMI